MTHGWAAGLLAPRAAPPAVAVGIRAAYGPRAAVPVVAAGVLLTSAFVAALVFGTSLSALISSSRSYGWPWDVAATTGGGLRGPGSSAPAPRSTAIPTWPAGRPLGYTNELSLDGQPMMTVMALDDVSDLDLSVLDGRPAGRGRRGGHRFDHGRRARVGDRRRRGDWRCHRTEARHHLWHRRVPLPRPAAVRARRHRQWAARAAGAVRGRRAGERLGHARRRRELRRRRASRRQRRSKVARQGRAGRTGLLRRAGIRAPHAGPAARDHRRRLHPLRAGAVGIVPQPSPPSGWLRHRGRRPDHDGGRSRCCALSGSTVPRYAARCGSSRWRPCWAPSSSACRSVSWSDGCCGGPSPSSSASCPIPASAWLPVLLASGAGLLVALLAAQAPGSWPPAPGPPKGIHGVAPGHGRSRSSVVVRQWWRGPQTVGCPGPASRQQHRRSRRGGSRRRRRRRGRDRRYQVVDHDDQVVEVQPIHPAQASTCAARRAPTSWWARHQGAVKLQGSLGSVSVSSASGRYRVRRGG